MTTATTVNSQYCAAPEAKQTNATVADLKKKYDSYAMDVCNKSKVKQIASMFDSQIAQSVEDVKDGAKCGVNNSIVATPQVKTPSPRPRHFDKQMPPIPTPRTKFNVVQKPNTSSISENDYAKLSVKHKVQLYNQFTNEMAQKNHKFDAGMEASAGVKTDVKGEVVNEKQASVKHLLAKLEASCGYPKVAPLVRASTSKNGMVKFNVKAREFEDLLPSSKGVNYREKKWISLPDYKSENKDDFKALLVLEAAHKRHNKQMRYCLPFEANAPPKKIRRTRTERLAPKDFFQSQESRNLFFSWLSERAQHHNGQKYERAENLSNTITDRHIEESCSKLEDKVNSTHEGTEKELVKFKRLEPKPSQCKKKPAPPVPAAASKATNFQISTNISVTARPSDGSESHYSQSERQQKDANAESLSNSITCQHMEESYAKLKDKDNSTNEKELVKFECLDSKPRQRKKKPAPPVPVPTSEAKNLQISTNISVKPRTNDKTVSVLSLRQKVSYSQSENLLLTWLSELEQKQTENGDQDETMSNCSIDQYLDYKDNSTDKGSEKEATNFKPLKAKPRQRKKRPAPPVPAPAPASKATNSPISENISGVKAQANDENESGLSLVQKITSDGPQADKPEVKTAKDFEFAKPLRPVRKRKPRRALTWQNDVTSEATTPTTNSTDSDTENKMVPPTYLNNEKELATHPSSDESDTKKCLREVNSAVYAPSPCPEDTEKTKYLNQETAQTWSPAKQQLNSLNKIPSLNANDMAANMFDSFTDQGFETGSNDMDSPVCAPDKQQVTEFTTEAISTASKETEAPPSCFSSLNKEHPPPAQCTNSRPHQQLGIPITIPLKSRRKSIYDNQPRRSSLAMQVIREDQPLDQHKIPARVSNAKEENFSVNAPTSDMPPADLAGLHNGKTSQFWIKCGYFSLSFDVFYNDANRVRLLFNIFSQKSYDSKDLAFGIDNFTFSVCNAYERESVSKRLPPKKKYSNYWVSTGDLIIPFAGKLISPDKIQHIFEFLKTAVETSDAIHFGIDGVEFSNVREFWNHSPKFSMDSNYSMLVGLQSGNSNGLEGRSKYAWPHTKPTRISDLNQANYEDDGTDSSRYSLSPFSDNQFEFTTSSPIELDSNQILRSSDVFAFGMKNDSLDYLFNEEHTESAQLMAAAAPADFNEIKTQQKRLSLKRQENPSAYNSIAYISCDASDALKGTPHYLHHLKSIVTKIISKHRRSGVNGTTV